MTNRNAFPLRSSNGGQANMNRELLMAAAARFFIEKLRVPVVPDWGIVANGVCQCRSRGECRNAGKHPAMSQ